MSFKDTVKEKFLNYASYINSKFPSIDGVKLVQRRLLYVLSYLAREKFVKSATVVGETIGKYHPHGDQAVYGSLVGLVRRNYAIGKGNWGSDKTVEKLEPAAYRYTEVKASEHDLFVKMYELLKYADYTVNDLGNKEPLLLPTIVPITWVRLAEDVYPDSVIGVGITNMTPTFLLKDLYNILHRLVENYGEKLYKRNVQEIFAWKIDDKNLDAKLLPKINLSINQKAVQQNVIDVGILKAVVTFNIEENKQGARYVFTFKRVPSSTLLRKLEEIGARIHDLSNDKLTNVQIVVQQKDYEKAKELIYRYIQETYTIRNYIAVYADEGKVPVVRMSFVETLLKQFMYYVLCYRRALKTKIDKIYTTIDELKIVEYIKQHSELLKTSETPESFARKIQTQQFSQDQIIAVLSKYPIKRLLTIKTDISQLQKYLMEIENKYANTLDYILKEL